MKIKQYQVVIVNLDPTVGGEIRKTRPCIVLSPNELNKHLKTVTVAPVASQSKNYPTRVPIILRQSTSWVAVDQIRTIDRTRITKAVGKLSGAEISQIKDIIRETFVD